MDQAETTRQRLQAEIVKIITAKMESGEMTEERAKMIAQMVLEKLPDNVSYLKMMEIIPTLDDQFQELTAAVVPIMVEYEQKMKVVIDTKIKDLLQQGKMDEALDVAKKAIEFEKKLS